MRERILSPNLNEIEEETVQKVEIEQRIEDFVRTPKWELLTTFSAAELNRMCKLEQVELLQEVVLIVLPTNYIFSPTGKVSCSCGDDDCQAIGKHPKVSSYKGITPEIYSKRRSYFFKRFKKDLNLNLGLKPFGFSVLDVDYPKGGGYSLELLREEIYGLDETLSVNSPNGEHLYTSSAGFNQSTSSLGEGLDIRSDKTTGFIVAPGSTHRSGGQYLWSSVSELQPIPDEWLSFDRPIGTKGSTSGLINST